LVKIDTLSLQHGRAKTENADMTVARQLIEYSCSKDGRFWESVENINRAIALGNWGFNYTTKPSLQTHIESKYSHFQLLE